MGQISLHVVPNASAFALEFLPALPGSLAPVLKVRLPEKAQDGRANLALEKRLSALSGTPVRIVRGHTGRKKTVAFATGEDEFLAALERAWRRQQESA